MIFSIVAICLACAAAVGAWTLIRDSLAEF
jgi:hypothetical protein